MEWHIKYTLYMTFQILKFQTMDVVERVKASKISGANCLDFYADWAETYDKVT